MKTRYYLLMLSIFLLALIFSFTFLIMSGDVYSFLSSLTMDFTFLCLINLIGIYFIYRPVDKFFKTQSNYENFCKRISKLPIYSSIWLGILFFLETFPFTFFIVLSSFYPNMISTDSLKEITGLMPTDNYWIWICFFCYLPLFAGLYIFFLIDNYNIHLKEYIYKKYGILLSPEKGKIWRRLIFSFFIVSILPISLIFIISFTSNLSSVSIYTYRLAVPTILIIIIGITFTVYFVTYSLKKPINILLDSFVQVRLGDYSIKTPIVSNDEIGFLTANFNRMVEGLQERELIRDTFVKYVTKSVADTILNQKVNLKGEVRLATILFTDIENYTSISENIPPEEIISTLNEYFSFIVEVITKYNGVVNKFIGDAVLAIYNAPIEDPDHAKNAVYSAIEIQNLSIEKKFGRGLLLKTRIGVNTGIIVVGNIGAKDRLEYTVIGDEVNVASRLEQLNKIYGTQILVGENTHELTKEHFNFEQIGEIKLKGKSKDILVYKIK